MFDSTVADLSSMAFLGLYAAVCVATVVLARWYVGKVDASTAEGQEPLPQSFDPFEIAYLRGGANELVRYAVFDLTRHGLLELVPAEKKRQPPLIRRTGREPNLAQLHPSCAVVYAFFDRPHTAEELFASTVPADVDASFAAGREDLQRRRLFTGDPVREASRTARWGGLAIVLSLGGYRIWYALAMHHRNIGFTIVILVTTIVLLLALTRVPRLSLRGRRYVATLRASLAAPEAAPSPESAAFPIMVAAGGFALLAATPYADLNLTFRQQAAGPASAACSGGCGSSGSSGGGGGSSCGGGGGCGGGCGG